MDVGDEQAPLRPKPGGCENETESRALVENLSRGAPGAVDSLLQRYLPGLRLFLRARAGALVGARESESDLAQSVCREVLQRLEGGDFEYRGEAPFKQWLYQAALFKIQDRRRYWLADKRAAERDVPLDVLAAGRSSAGAPGDVPLPNRTTPSEDAVLREELEAMRQAFERLPERYAHVLRCVHFEGRSHREVAEELGISEANSRMLLSRALARLAKLRAEQGRS